MNSFFIRLLVLSAVFFPVLFAGSYYEIFGYNYLRYIIDYRLSLAVHESRLNTCNTSLVRGEEARKVCRKNISEFFPEKFCEENDYFYDPSLLGTNTSSNTKIQNSPTPKKAFFLELRCEDAFQGESDYKRSVEEHGGLEKQILMKLLLSIFAALVCLLSLRFR